MVPIKYNLYAHKFITNVKYSILNESISDNNPIKYIK